MSFLNFPHSPPFVGRAGKGFTLLFPHVLLHLIRDQGSEQVVRLAGRSSRATTTDIAEAADPCSHIDASRSSRATTGGALATTVSTGTLPARGPCVGFE